MKKLYLVLIIFLTVFLLSSCEKEPVTYRFIDEDTPKLLPHYIEGNILTFVNEIGEERKFKIEKIEQKISTQDWIYRDWDGTRYAYFYCEPKFILLIDLETQVTFYFSIARFPLDLQKATVNNTRLQPSSLFGQFHIVEEWWNSHYYFFRFFFNFDEFTQVVTLNGVNYDNVIVVTNYSTDGSNGGALIGTKTIYYNVSKGLIGFDDENNHQWVLKD